MASYTELEPTKKGEQRIKITVEKGYDEETGERLRYTKTVRMKTMSDRAIRKAMTDYEIEVSEMEEKTSLSNITFGNFVEKKWKKLHVSTLEETSEHAYQSALDGGIMERFNKMKLNEIKPIHIIEWFNKQVEEKKKNLKSKYVVLSSIFSKAVEWEVIERSPMKKVKEPSGGDKRYKEFQFYDEGQLIHLLKVIENIYLKHKIMIKFGCLVGLRVAEIAGIVIQKMNYNSCTILIDKQLKYSKKDKKKYLGPTKNKIERIVDVPPSFMQEIKEYAKEQMKMKNRMGDAWNGMKDENGNDVDLLFTLADGTTPTPRSMGSEWTKIVKRHDLPEMTFHGLRHTYASYQLSKGADYKVIQEQLGHSTITQTINTYSHLVKEDKIKAAQNFESIL